MFLPTSIKEMAALGWAAADVILVTGDAYIDHPSFGAAVIGRLLQAEGLKVAVIPQPNWRDDLRDFRKLGAPRLFFGVTAGAMDSMVNHYTAAKRLRSDDAYTPGGAAGFRPDRAATVYTRILKRLYPDVPVVLGGIEASLRRLTHYDYWDDGLRPSILVESGADVVSYGMGERAMVDLARAFAGSPPAGAGQAGLAGSGAGLAGSGAGLAAVRRLPQVAFLADEPPAGASVLHSFEDCVRDPAKFGENFVRVETESNLLEPGHTLVEPLYSGWAETSRTGAVPQRGRSQKVRRGDRFRELSVAKEARPNQKFVVVNPPYPLMSTETLDAAFELPYTRQPHPRYAKKGEIPAWAMIRNSVNIHRGCFGGCSFCTISAHQGKFITSRSPESVLREVRRLTEMDYFRGNISDLGGPSANMYLLGGHQVTLCRQCRRPSCLTPLPCPNLRRDHAPLLELYRRVGQVPGVRRSYIGSGIRYDLFQNGDYLREVVVNHTSGRLKVAPEHTEEHILRLMRKPPWADFERLHADFARIVAAAGLRTQLIPYFISSHPGCTEGDMRALASKTRRLRLQTEQVQDFTPTPMTLASVMYHTGRDPYTGQKLFVERDVERKKKQKSFFLRKQ